MLTIKKINIKSFSDNVVFVSKSCHLYNVKKLRTLTRVEVLGGKKTVYAFLEVIDEDALVSPTQIGVNVECFKDLGLKEGDAVSIAVSETPKSYSLIKKKIYGNILSTSEYKKIADDIISKRYSNMDIAAFLVAMGSFMTLEEVLSLTKSIISKNKMKWEDEHIVADHYCIGGVPGNKTDLIILAIVSAYGIAFPKTCSFSLTSCSGMGNVASAFMNIDLKEKEFKTLVSENRAAIVAYDTLNVGDFNKQMSPVERYIGLTKAEQIAASIIAVKISCGITHLLIDIPVGPQARIRSSLEAMKLRKIFEYLGDSLGLHVDVCITDGREPIGNTIGPFLEARDVMKILKNQEDAPDDLREKSLFLAGKILEFDPKLRGGQGFLVAKEILESGRALDQFNKIISSQGRAEKPELGFLSYDFVSPQNGVVKAIDVGAINYLGVVTGANRNKLSGVEMFKKIGDEVEAGDVLFRVYSNTQSDFLKAKMFLSEALIYEVD
ncbi:MAG: thymidine phosphorylase [Alphaproteobacteria bacterium]